jgi:uncharacterized membrane protein YvbJ
MVYCVKCGTKNPDETETCTQCGTPLHVTKESVHYERMEKECFGIPKGNTIVGLFFGIIIILAGVSWLGGYEWTLLWPTMVIIFGILVIIGALCAMQQRH